MANLTVNLTPALVGLTYGEIRAYFEKRFDEDNENIDTVMKTVLMEIVSRHDWKWLHQQSVITTQAGLAQYALESDCMQLDTEHMIIQANTQVVVKRSLGYVRQLQAKMGDDQGTPTVFADTGDNTVIFFPTPDAEMEVLYDYTMRVSNDVSDDNAVPPLPRHFQHVLFSGMEEIMRMDDDRIDGATNLARRKLERQLQDMIWREESGEQVRMVPDVEPPDVAWRS